jgi:hypothetical protein
MAPPTKGRRLKSPVNRVLGREEGYFFPNEVVRMLQLQALDYRQLRRLFRLVATARGEVPARKWARFSFRDLVAIRAAVLALGGSKLIASGKRLPLKRLERACEVLREQYKIRDPLTQSRLRWDGKDVVVELRGARFEPESGQLLLGLSDRVDQHVTYASIGDHDRRALRKRITREAKQVKENGKRATRVFPEGIPTARLSFGRRAQ